MWHLTRHTGDKFESNQTFKYLDLDIILPLLYTVGYKLDPILSDTEWDRYVLTLNYPNGEVRFITLEKEEE